jgi:predicted O-methyltransferase YrrM
MANPRIRLNPRYLSDIAWDQWAEILEPELPAVRQMLADTDAACEAVRPMMAYNTGSVSFSTMMLLYVLVRNVKPGRIFEVGTFIGKSVLSMAHGCDRNGQPAEIYTCDGSNDFHVPKLSRTQIIGFGKSPSTAVLQLLAEKKLPLDLLHLDGRIGPQDIELLEKISDDKLVVVLDDFEGMEKGVANLMQLRQRPQFARHVLIYPPSSTLIGRMGLQSSSTTALLLPFSALQYTNQ